MPSRAVPGPLHPSARAVLLALAVVAVMAAAGACNPSPSASSENDFASAKKREPARVLVEPLRVREMVRRLETTTRVESESQVQVFPRAMGVVVELFVEEGDSVESGQALAQLDDRDARLRVDDAKAGLRDARANVPKLELASRESQARLDAAERAAEQSERDHDRNVAISKGGPDTPGLISNKDLDASLLALDRARSDLATARLALERSKVEQKNGEIAVERAEVALARAELELSFTQVAAPVAGVIAERSIKLGDTVSTAAAAFTLTDPTRLRAVFYRPQRELELFGGALGLGGSPGAAANGAADGRQAELSIVARSEALPGRTFGGRIERVAPTIDAASGNFRVTAKLDCTSAESNTARLLPGMLVRLEIITDRRPEALVAPKRSIRREGDRSTIQIVSNGVARSVAIVEGFSDDEWIEVSPVGEAKLAAGQLVVVVGNRDLEDGAEVVATDATGAVLDAPEAEASASEGAPPDSTQPANDAEAAPVDTNSGAAGE